MAGEDDQAAASPPLALDEPPELTRTESYRNEPVLPVQTTRVSTRDKEATKRHNEERDHSCRSTKVCKTRVPQAQVSRGLLMRSALPEELEARAEGEDIRDTVFTVPLLRDYIINMIHNMEKDIELPRKEGVEQVAAQEPPWKWFTASELGFPLLDDNYDRPMHPLVEAYAREGLQDPEMLDDNEEMGVCCENTAYSLPELSQNMLVD